MTGSLTGNLTGNLTAVFRRRRSSVAEPDAAVFVGVDGTRSRNPSLLSSSRFVTTRVEHVCLAGMSDEKSAALSCSEISRNSSCGGTLAKATTREWKPSTVTGNSCESPADPARMAITRGCAVPLAGLPENLGVRVKFGADLDGVRMA